jgi:hypothetical protein
LGEMLNSSRRSKVSIDMVRTEARRGLRPMVGKLGMVSLPEV